MPLLSPISRAVATLLVLLLSSSHGSATEPAKSGLDLGLVINIDGDNAFPSQTLELSTKALQAEVDRYADAGVKTLCYSVAAGSDIMLYPTRVADTWGWRSTPYDSQPEWQERIARIKSNMAEGGDAIRTAGERAKARGMLFFPSQRMNDAHYAFGKPPEDYPLSGSFWLKHRDLTLGSSPIRAKPEYGNLLDFAHKEVRDYRLSQIYEAIDRYQDIIDGFELDFTRFQIFFREGAADQGAPLMTQFVRDVRTKLDQVGSVNHRRLALVVRIPPSPKNCQWSGLSIKDWAAEDLVDVIVPSQMMTMGFEQPIDEFKQLMGDTGTKVYSGLLPRVSWSFPFVSPTATKKAVADRALSVAQLRGAVENAWSLNADGLYLFNFQHYAAWAASGNAAVDLNDAEGLASGEQVFSITKAYWCDNEDSYEYRKQLPATVSAGAEATFSLLVGSRSLARSDRELWLRVGIREPMDQASVMIKLNGVEVIDGPVASVSTSAFDTADATVMKVVNAAKDLPTRFVTVKLTPSAHVVRGRNLVTIRAETAGLQITDVDVGLFEKAGSR